MWKNSNGSLTDMPRPMSEKIIKTRPKPILTKIVSNTPGRLRLRVAHSHRQKEEMQRLAKTLEANPSINNVRTNIHQGSITIQHNADDESFQNVLAALYDLGIIFADITPGKTEAAAGVSNSIVDLNQRVHDVTNGLIDLRIIMPIGLASLSIRQLLTKGLQLETIPWYVLAWYAFDSFIKLHGNTSQPKSTSEE
ncbi:hypothetical protein CEN40_08340 [Fischerella thermalis CCMEE 5205]|uniref:Uncharacterized protein n=1 Tax=Fischerella thermalis CCMEE 5318 TaxID=2019666 RepID=A0A2N6LI75_9CYAN|nr:hypothetical protein [Fischerella thermalis]PMB23961.1 hypothetical protein CEN46_09100 [Fischerella thermalis CCMEE 5318]PMB42094.1 hypothetical protein CEN47_01690 [Fischerella thermalis CCMEE 5319]PMB47699.1 hypothetical protein CEN40_08340 [Fischerella thermalis CCMEE 5205]